MRRVKAIPFPQPLVTDAIGFGLAVRAARTGTGMTLADAALSIGVARQTLQDLETGSGTVGIGLAMKIAHELGVSVFVVPSSERSPVTKVLGATLSAHAVATTSATATLS
jgi:DNA-binding XRE family transcriptional regulator